VKLAFFQTLGGTAKEAAEKLYKAVKSSPQALKRNTFSATYGTTEVVPFPKNWANQSFSAACKAACIEGFSGTAEAVPFPKPL
jgi:hypothetical protein